MKRQLTLAAVVLVAITALAGCGGSSSSRSGASFDPTLGEGPLPDDPTLTDPITGETLDPIERVPLTGSNTALPDSEEIYDIKRYVFPVVAGLSYSINGLNDVTSSSSVTARLRTELCPGSAGAQNIVPVGTVCSFEYNADELCELLFDIVGVAEGSHHLAVDRQFGADLGLLQEPASQEPNNTGIAASSLREALSVWPAWASMGLYDDVDYYVINVLVGQTINLSVPAHGVANDGPLMPDLLGQLRTPVVSGLTADFDRAISQSVTVNYSGSLLLRFTQMTVGQERSNLFSATPEA